MGDEHVRHFLYPGGARALLDRCVYCVLHNVEALPVLPHTIQQPGAYAERFLQVIEITLYNT